MTYALPLFIALLLDAALGEPQWLWRRITHPVVLMGRLVDAFDASLNHGTYRRMKGALARAFAFWPNHHHSYSSCSYSAKIFGCACPCCG
jgi:cobalamin biosynthesis protein CobD/CbiB